MINERKKYKKNYIRLLTFPYFIQSILGGENTNRFIERQILFH